MPGLKKRVFDALAMLFRTPVSAVIKPVMLIMPGLLLAGLSAAHAATPVGTGSGAQAVTIANDGPAASELAVSALEFSDPTHFVLASGGSCGSVPFNLSGGQSCTQLVEFVPQTEGLHTATLQVTSDAGEVVNDVVALSGTGVEGPTPAIAPDPLNFGLVNAASLPVTDSFTLSNIGDPVGSFDVTGLVLTGDAEFSIAAQTCQDATLFGGDSCTVTIQFDAATDGSFSGQLTVQTTAGDVSAQIQGATQIPERVVFVQQPATATVNQAIAPAIVVQVQDSSGTRVSLDNDTEVVLSFAADPTGVAGLGGTISRQVSAGEAVFDDLTVDQVGAGFVLRAADSAGQLTTDDSAAFDVLAGAPSALAFAVQPSSTPVGATMAPPVEVHVLDSFGNVVDWDDTTQVALALAGGNPVASLSGGEARVVSGGVAAFAGLAVDQAGSGYELVADSASGGIAGASSTAFEITAGSSATTITGIDPAGSQAVDAPYEVSVSVSGLSPTGSVAVSDGAGANCVITLPASACELVSTSVGSRTITADYSGDENNQPSSAAIGYEIVAAAAEIAIVAVDPPDSQRVNEPYTVSVEVTGASPVGTVSIDDGTGGSCQLVLPSASCQLTSTTVGAKTLTAVYSGDSNNSGAEASQSYAITAGPAAALEFVVQPTSTPSAVAIAPAVAVQVVDEFGNPVVEDDATEVALSLVGGAPAAVLGGAAPQTVTAGVAVFDALTIDLAATGYRLEASAAGLSGAISGAFDVGAGPAARLGFAVQPSTTLVGSPMAPAVTVRVEDAAGNRVISDQSTAIELELEGGSAGANLSGAGPLTVIDGRAEFSAVSVDLVGADYQLRALDTDGLLAEATSAAFNIAGSSSSTEIVGVAPADSQSVGQTFVVSVSVTGASPTGTVTVTDGAGASCSSICPARPAV